MHANGNLMDGGWGTFIAGSFAPIDGQPSGQGQPDDDLLERLDPLLRPQGPNRAGPSFMSSTNGDIGSKDSGVLADGSAHNPLMGMGMGMGMGWTRPSPSPGGPSYGHEGYLGEINNTPGFNGDFGNGASPASFDTLLPPVAQNSPRCEAPPDRDGGALPTASGLARPTPHDGREWSYAIDVWPAEDRPGESCVSENYLRIERELTHKRFNWSISILQTGDGPPYRRYVLEARRRFDEKRRLQFLQIFNSNRQYNKHIPGYRYGMSVVYERQFHSNDGFPVIPGLDGQDDGAVADATYGDDNDVTDLAAYTSTPPAPQPLLSPEPHHALDIAPAPVTLPTSTSKEEPDARISQRAKAIPKPEREISKNARGKYECTWQGCSESVREFNRKCEWSKHMDKHERPFKCGDPACEKLSGFTYSGGLLRHQREVHGEYGGPKNPLNCPHVNCKRHTGKGFSRLENLNEHLRRVHTSTGANGSGDELHEEMAGVGAHAAATPAAPPPMQQLPPSLSPVVLGEKRKADDNDDLRGEVKRLHTMNESLQQQLAAQKAQAEAKEEAQKQQMMAMMASMHDLKERLGQAEEQLRQQQQQQRGSILDESHSFP